MALADQITSLFPTTLLRRHIEGMSEVNRQLVALLAQMEASGPNAVAGTSTHGGYQTPEGLFAEDHTHAQNPALMTLKRHVGAAVTDYATLLIRQECAHVPKRANWTLWGWAVSLKDGGWQDQHVHSGAHVSGVYYVAAPPDAQSGKIVFRDPRPRANMNQLPTQLTAHRETPVPGDMILFPSWLEHGVEPFRGPGERICIAFDARLELTY